MCPRERLLIISKPTGLSLLKKGLGHLLQLLFTAFYLLALYLSAIYQKTLQIYLSVFTVISCIETAGQYILLLGGFDTLSYRKYYDTPLYLWVIKTIFWRRCRGVKHYWEVELIKEASAVSDVFITVYCLFTLCLDLLLNLYLRALLPLLG